MLHQTELLQVRNYIVRILPEVIRQEPEIGTALEDVLTERFPRRDEFDRLLDEMKTQRIENTRRFNRLEDRADKLDDKLEAHRTETRQRFEQVDQRFEQVDQRFEQVDQRFERIEERLDDHGERLTRLERISLETRRNVAKLQAGQEQIIRRMDRQDKWISFIAGEQGNEKGGNLEDMVAIALSYGLKNPQITPESIRLRQKLVDREGLIFRPGFETEIDLIAFEDSLTIFHVLEVKATLDNSGVEVFGMKIELLAKQHPDKKVRGVLIALSTAFGVRERCEKYGIELLP